MEAREVGRFWRVHRDPYLVIVGIMLAAALLLWML
jgi:hypothetical protein